MSRCAFLPFALVVASIVCSHAYGLATFKGTKAVLSERQVPLQNLTASGPERGCLPKQWSSKVTVLNTVNSDKINVWDIQIDYRRQQEVILNYTGSPKPVNKVLMDYGKRMLYSVPTDHPSYCFKIPFNMPLLECIPDDAEYLGSSYLGPMGDGQLPYDVWRFRLDQFLVTLAMTKEGHVPVVEGVSSPYVDKELYLFSKFEPRLTDPSAFELPPSCK